MEWLGTLQDARLARLFRRAQRGDREAFRAVYRSLYPRVAGYVARRVANREDAEDLIALSFEKLLEGLDRWDAERGTVLAFALRIARNSVIDHRRVRRETEPVPEDLAASGAGALEAIVEGEEIAAVRAALAMLPAEVREIVALRAGDGLRWREIAELTGSTEAAVRQRWSRAVREIRGATRARVAREVVDGIQ